MEAVTYKSKLSLGDYLKNFALSVQADLFGGLNKWRTNYEIISESFKS